ncbi:hypothetical protein AB1Y20_004785 [Prymnesium parvum]|uniref:Calmodulin-lysine N-methyltransferase n=1 Tax=Prymnesium parvum TaxID=97485 RepID=A0AB34IXK5_PRYPA
MDGEVAWRGNGAAMEALVAAGDVDALRRFLRHGSAANVAEPPLPRPSTNMYASADHIVLRLAPDCPPLRLVSSRVMGKVVWPAGHAVALHLCESFADRHHPSPSPPPSIFLEVGAGAGVTALAAAAVCGRAFPLVLATDFTEAGVQLLEENAARNHSRLRCARLDVCEEGALCAALDAHMCDGLPRDVCICACDMAYDEHAIERLFASAASAAGRWRPHVWLARSSNFEHLDEHSRAVALRHGFAVAARHRLNGCGVQDALSMTYLNPCVDDVTDLFIFRLS